MRTPALVKPRHQEDISASRIILAIATVSGFALAQSPAPKAQITVPAATAHTTGMNADKGLRTADSATVAVKFVTVQPADFMSSKLVGVNVYNNQNESLGEIEDLVIDNVRRSPAWSSASAGSSGWVKATLCWIPPRWCSTRRTASGGLVDTSKDNLKNAPKFKYTKARS